MATARYLPIDEPRPSPIALLATSPLLPFIAVQTAGGWLGWNWFLLNALALGSPTARRELGWVLAGALGGGAILTAVAALGDGGAPGRLEAYGALALMLWRAACAAMIAAHQLRCVALRPQSSPRALAGVLVLIAEQLLVREHLSGRFDGHPFLAGVLG